ncbi:unnamed protein product, partial [Didymodactylos carnosus]
MAAQEGDIDFYALYDSGIDDDFKMQMLLTSQKKCDFDCIRNIRLGLHEDRLFVSKIYHYKLKYDMNMKQDFGTSCPQYYIRVSQQKTIQPTCHFEDKTMRSFNFQTPSHFIFSLQFEKPGGLTWSHLSTCPGESISIWHQLWQFTYFLIMANKLHTFESFVMQFLVALRQHGDEKLDYNDLQTIFKYCYTYIGIIQNEKANNSDAISALIYMFGLMKINTSNIVPVCLEAQSLITIVLRSFLTHINSVLDRHRDPHYIDSGLVNLLFIEILSNNTSNADSDTVFILRRLSICQRNVVNQLISKLFKYKPLIKRENWLDLFTLTQNQTIPVECLTLIATFKDYMTFATSMVSQKQEHESEDDLKKKLLLEFNDLLRKHQFEINCQSIIYILKTLHSYVDNSLYTRMSHYIFENSEELRTQIQNYLVSSASINFHLDEIRDLFRYNNLFILQNIDDKTTFLLKHLNRSSLAGSTTRSIDFYIKWFENFICDSHYTQTKPEYDDFQRLFDGWLQHIKQNPSSLFDSILQSIDQLLSKLPQSSISDERMKYIVRSILKYCFESRTMERYTMNIICIDVKNNYFLNEYKAMYTTDVIEPNRDKLKRMSSDNPLYGLVQEYKIKPSDLLKQLIELCTTKITIDRNYAINDVLKGDRQSFISTILSAPCFKGTQIHQTVIYLLLEILTSWSRDGMKYDDLQRVLRYNNNQKMNFGKVWDYVNTYATEKTNIYQLIESTTIDMNTKMKIINVIDTCLKQYCVNSNDIDTYESALNDVTTQLNVQSIRSVKIPDGLMQMLLFANELNPYGKSTTWQQYQHENSIVQTTCLNHLTETSKLFKKFQHELDVSFQWETSTLEQIVRRFKTIGFAVDLELDRLKKIMPSLDELRPLLHYWKSRDYITKVCHGCLQIISLYKLSNDDHYSIISNNILSLTIQTNGDACYQYYRDYCNEFSSKHEKLILNLCAQYYSAYELISFLSDRTENDMNNLHEGANDNDDTMITTENVSDFELIHLFLHRLKQSNIHTFDDFIQIAQTLLSTNNTIIQKLETCTSLLAGLQQLFLELTDKQESKRRKIFLIVTKSFIQFKKMSPKNIDVCINTTSQLLSSNDNSLNYLEICELRDRARLIE